MSVDGTSDAGMGQDRADDDALGRFGSREPIDDLLSLLAAAKTAAPETFRDDMWAAITQDDSGSDGELSIADQYALMVEKFDTSVHVTDLTVEDSLTACRARLAEAFEDRFRLLVRPDRFGRALLVSWSGGPTEADVRQVVNGVVGLHETELGPIRSAFYRASLYRTFTTRQDAWARRTVAESGVDTNDDGFERQAADLLARTRF